MTKTVLLTDYVWPSVEPEKAVLATAGAEIIVAPDGQEETLVSLAKDVDGIMTCFAKVTEKVVRAANKAVVIGRFGVGVDNIDVKTATELGIAVTYVPDYCVEEVSDHVMALMLAWNRRIVLHNDDTKRHGWGTAGLGMRIMRLKGKKIGVVGFGRIGRSVARKCKAFGMDVLISDPFVNETQAQETGVRKVELPDLLEQSHFVTLHSPLTPETNDMIGIGQFNLMRNDAFLINCARGGLVNENALHKALTSGAIAGAGLDVVVDLTPSVNHKILQLSNVIVTPHTAFFSQEAVLELEERAAGEVASVLNGKMPNNLFNTQVLKNSRMELT